MVTLKDIARECRVSFSTVSKALKGSSEISAETIKIIQEKAAQMGYHPNLAARTLRTNRTTILVLYLKIRPEPGFSINTLQKSSADSRKLPRKKTTTLPLHLNLATNLMTITTT